MDIRIYYYTAGQLKKEGHLKNRHQHPSIDSAKAYLNRLCESRKDRGWKMEKQYILVEYTGAYESKIIEIVEYL